MTRITAILVLVVAVCAATYVATLRFCSSRQEQQTKMLWFAHLEYMNQQSTDAYLHGDPHAGIWAIQHSIALHHTAGPAHELLGTDTPLFMSVSYARLAKLHRSIGDESGYRKHMDLALGFAEQKAGHPVAEATLLGDIAKLDQIEREASQQTAAR